jgi:phospholipid/cholesterol/gamma-HCH transport system substrate-binding protein
MEKDAHYFTIGLFVTAMIVALVGFTIWLAGDHGQEKGNFYTVYFTDPVAGVSEGTDVTYRGMPVGKVLDIRLDPDKSDLIKVDIEVKKDTPVRAHTKAELVVQGITGLLHLDLSTEPDDRGEPERIEGEKYPVLHGRPSQISRILDGISKLTTQGSAAAASVNQLATQLKKNPSQIIFGVKDKDKDKDKNQKKQQAEERRAKAR